MKTLNILNPHVRFPLLNLSLTYTLIPTLSLNCNTLIPVTTAQTKLLYNLPKDLLFSFNPPVTTAHTYLPVTNLNTFSFLLTFQLFLHLLHTRNLLQYLHCTLVSCPFSYFYTPTISSYRSYLSVTCNLPQYSNTYPYSNYNPSSYYCSCMSVIYLLYFICYTCLKLQYLLHLY